MKTKTKTYIAWLFACHYIYLGKWSTQFFYWITLGGIGIWTLIDMFRIPSMVRKHNEQILALASWKTQTK